MYTATVQVTINSFAPISKSGPSIDATLSLPTNTSAPGSGGSKVFPKAQQTPQKITVCPPPTYVGAVQLTFQLADPAYVLVGIAVIPEESQGSAGRQQFRTVSINRDPSGSQMVVTDACLPLYNNVNFTYVMLVQQISSGLIGKIDPDIDNEN
jgi:hypothetical protein